MSSSTHTAKRSLLESEKSDHPMASSPTADPPIIFFDGVCALCNGFVNFVLRRDKSNQFRFAPIQGETAREFLPPIGENPREWSIIYIDENGTHQQSDATLRIFKRIGGGLEILSWSLVIPRWIRNPIYRLIASNRYRLFGKLDSCRLADKGDESRFLP